jgi:hypothetical protein
MIPGTSRDVDTRIRVTIGLDGRNIGLRKKHWTEDTLVIASRMSGSYGGKYGDCRLLSCDAMC